MEVINIWQAIFATISVISLIVSIRASIWKVNKAEVAETRLDAEAQAELDAKIRSMEEKLEGQYRELTSKINGLEKSLEDRKISNYTFETRILSSIDKFDGKLERIQDLVVNALINKQSTN